MSNHSVQAVWFGSFPFSSIFFLSFTLDSVVKNIQSTPAPQVWTQLSPAPWLTLYPSQQRDQRQPEPKWFQACKDLWQDQLSSSFAGNDLHGHDGHDGHDCLLCLLYVYYVYDLNLGAATSKSIITSHHSFTPASGASWGLAGGFCCQGLSCCKQWQLLRSRRWKKRNNLLQ